MKLDILVVDDDFGIRQGLGRFMGREHNVTLAEDGQKALTIFDEQHFDLVFTDVRMPGIDGLSVLKKMKVLKPETFVVVMTGYANDQEVAALANQGAVDCIRKPFNVENIKEVIKKRVPFTEDGKVRLLAVDDDAVMRNLFEQINNQDNIQVLTAETAPDALKILNEEAIDILFQDVVLKESDGIALSEEVKNLFPNIKIVLCSGFEEKYDNILNHMNQGAFYAVDKPFDLDELREIITKVQAYKTKP